MSPTLCVLTQPKLCEMAESDPYYVIRDNIFGNVETIKLRYSRFSALVMSVNTAEDQEFKDLKKGLVRDIKNNEKQLRELKAGAIDMVSQNRAKFPHIADVELDERRKFVQSMAKVLADVRQGMEAPQVAAKMHEDMKRAAQEAQSRDALGANPMNAREVDNSKFVNHQRGMVHAQIERQDVDLEALGQGVDRLGQHARVINTELKEQSTMLEKLGDDMGDAKDRMNFVLDRLGKLLGTKDTCQIVSIVALAVILLILLFMVIYV